MLYYKQKKAKKLKSVDTDSVVEALKILNAVGINTKGIEFFTEEQRDEYIEYKREKTPEELWESLPSKSKEIWEFAVEGSVDKISKEDIENYNLLKDTDKPYYVICYWSSGQCGYFSDVNGLKDAYNEKMNAYYDESFDISVFCSKTYEPIDVKTSVSISISIDGGEWQ